LLRVWSIAKLNISLYLDTNKHDYDLIINKTVFTTQFLRAFLVLSDKYITLLPYFTADAYSKTESNSSHKWNLSVTSVMDTALRKIKM
jgi:hypothetical protein